MLSSLPISRKTKSKRRAAKSVMDTLEMLVSKTRGNLASTEEKLLATALQNLRPLYAAAVEAAKS